jgi:hypothetical protein
MRPMITFEQAVKILRKYVLVQVTGFYLGENPSARGTIISGKSNII